MQNKVKGAQRVCHKRRLVLYGDLQRPKTSTVSSTTADVISSASAILFPTLRLIEACRKRGVLTLVDGAHAPGHVSNELVEQICARADFFVGALLLEARHVFPLLPPCHTFVGCTLCRQSAQVVLHEPAVRLPARVAAVPDAGGAAGHLVVLREGRGRRLAGALLHARHARLDRTVQRARRDRVLRPRRRHCTHMFLLCSLFHRDSINVFWWVNYIVL